MEYMSVALDGPAGAGKSTIAKIVAKILNLTYIDTGAMYRAITLKILNEGINIKEAHMLEEMLSNTKVDMVGDDIYLDGKLLGDEIRKPEINEYVSYVAKIPSIRMKMVDLQRKIAVDKSVIMDGRDIGSNVLPNATYKFYLTASIEERAKRRHAELISKGFNNTFEDVKVGIENRDKIDTEREFAPLKQSEDAILIDTTGKTIEGVVNAIILRITK